jgi:hypothetical protein
MTEKKVAELLEAIRKTRAGMHSVNGWSWRAAGYHYDPDDGAHKKLTALMRELDAALAPPPPPPVPAERCPRHAWAHVTCGHGRLVAEKTLYSCGCLLYTDPAKQAEFERFMASRIESRSNSPALLNRRQRTPEEVAAVDAVLHPNGRCTCAGEGRCTWCLSRCLMCGAFLEHGSCPGCGPSGALRCTIPPGCPLPEGHEGPCAPRPLRDCCQRGDHSFSWRQGIEPCRYCGAPPENCQHDGFSHTSNVECPKDDDEPH